MSESANTITVYGRLSYFYGYEGYEGTDDNGKKTISYPTHVIMEPGSPDVQRVSDLIRKVAGEAWQDKAGDILKQLKAQDRLCLHNGDVTKAGEGPYAGRKYVSCGGKKRPRIIATRGGVNVDVPPGQPDSPYSGAWGNVMFSVWAQGANGSPSKFGKRINAQVMGIQFVKRDEAFGGGRTSSPDEFPTVPTDADAPAPMGADAGEVDDLA